MGYTDRTADLREIIKLKQGLTLPAKRRKLATEEDPRDTFGKRYVEEAYTIVRQLSQVPTPTTDNVLPS